MARVGWAECRECGNPEMSVDENGQGTLTTRCHRCRTTAYAPKGTPGARSLRARMRPDESAEPAQPAAPASAPAASAPAPKPASSVFSLGNL